MLNHKWEMNLAGDWELILEDNSKMKGTLPGCTYLALMENNRIEDPFWGSNEQAASGIAEQRYRYKRDFILKEEDLRRSSVELVLDGADTLAEIFINKKPAGKTQNAFRIYRFQVKELLKKGKNEIEINFEPPHEVMQKSQEKRPLAGMNIGVPGISYIRKPQYHFGWDWGPCLPPAGISGGIRLEGYSCAKLDRFTVIQRHENHSVYLTVKASCEKLENEAEPEPDRNVTEPELVWNVTAPDGKTWAQKTDFVNHYAEDTIQIQDPQLWWCSGMGEQPLYTVSVILQTGHGEEADSRRCQVGLRKIELNLESDEWGNNFQFRINGEPIFAKGANWIPTDSFINRVTDEKMEFYIRSAKEANMNMLRVWGGGYYETDRFYELCDKYGILVWQDFGFACRAYPLDEEKFLDNVKAEVRDQVRRLHYHACLALWCGNNELQLEELLWAKDKKLRKTIHQFFFQTLSEWVKDLDETTPYWYGSPSDLEAGKRANGLQCGDTHLWQVWHGLMPVHAFRRFPTRFCSEFGLESLPSKHTLAAFTDVKKATLQCKDIQSHQKSSRGNEKLLYYVTSRYHHPADLESTIYFTQIMQAEGIRSAVEFWRRNKGRCNGALYWQYNDCWPAVSWSGIDYSGQYKALHYLARSFYAPVSISAYTEDKKVMVQVINDRLVSCTGCLEWKAVRFDGSELASGKTEVTVDKTGVSEIITLEYLEILQGERPENVVVCIRLLEGQKEIAKRNQLLVKEKKIHFTRPAIKADLELDGRRGRLTLQSDRFAHYVELAFEGILLNFSDNFFDLEKDGKRDIVFELPEKMEKKELMERFRVHSYADFQVVNTPVKDAWMRFRMRWSLKGIKGRIMTRV